MSNKKITDLTELTTPTTDDVFPIVDIATNTTQKVQVGNLPIQSAVTTALATKQATLVSGTNIKTVNSTTLLGSGDIAVQPTLVSGTNIKTINSTSLLGSGDIAVVTSPSGVAGAIQFSNGSAFASDASNLFWDDTNNRLKVTSSSEATPSSTTGGILNINGSATNALIIGSLSVSPFSMYLQSGGSGIYPLALNPQGGQVTINTTTNLGAQLGIKGSGSTSATTSLLVQNSAGSAAFAIADDRQINFYNQLQGPLLRASNNFACSKYFSQNYAGQYMTIDDTLVNVNFGAVSAVASAQVQIDSTTKGFLPPRMTTTEKNAIATPAAGLVVYDNTTNKLCCYNGSTWNDLF